MPSTDRCKNSRWDGGQHREAAVTSGAGCLSQGHLAVGHRSGEFSIADCINGNYAAFVNWFGCGAGWKSWASSTILRMADNQRAARVRLAWRPAGRVPGVMARAVRRVEADV